MALTNTTIKIQSARIAYLTEEVSRLRKENEYLRYSCEVLGYNPRPEPPTPERDYDLGGDEWVDPATGRDTWDDDRR